MQKKKFNTPELDLGLLLMWSVLLTGCGGKVEGNTYAGNGGVVQLSLNQVARRMFRRDQSRRLVPTQKVERL